MLPPYQSSLPPHLIRAVSSHTLSEQSPPTPYQSSLPTHLIRAVSPHTLSEQSLSPHTEQLAGALVISIVMTTLVSLLWFFTGLYIMFVLWFGGMMGYLTTAVILFTPIGEWVYCGSAGDITHTHTHTHTHRIPCGSVPDRLCVWSSAGLWHCCVDDSSCGLPKSCMFLAWGCGPCLGGCGALLSHMCLCTAQYCQCFFGWELCFCVW